MVERGKFRSRRPLHLLLVLMLPLMTTSTSAGLHPVILVPGSGGNQLEARLTGAYRPSSLLCSPWARTDTSNGKWFRLWFDLTVLLPPLTKCFAERMTLRYDPVLDDYRNSVGVETRVPYFGSTEGLRYLDPYLKHITGYMEKLVESLEAIGYKDGSTLYGAPYDFRYGLAADGHRSKIGTQYLSDLQSLIENATISNGGKPAIIVSHSLGGLFVLHLLNRTPLSWRSRFVRHFVALSAPWGGAVQEMLTFASGYTLGIPLVDPLAVRAEQRSCESNLWLLPSPNVFGDHSDLVVAGDRSYTAADMVGFLEDVGFGEGVRPYETRTLPLVVEAAPPPFVPVTCFVGSGVETPEKLVYGDGGFDEQPEIVYGDGDGTVNMRSLTAVEKDWEGVEGQILKVVRLPGVSHTAVLTEEFALGSIVEEINEINESPMPSREGLSFV